MSRREIRNKKRITLDVSERFYERLNRLEELTDSESKAGVIRDALRVYEYLSRRAVEGDRFQTVGKDGLVREIPLLSIEVVEDHATS